MNASLRLLAGVILAASASTASALPFSTIRIGDVDGFGFSPTTGLFAASGGAADTNANGLLQPGEFLPDLNGNGNVQTSGGDDFDNRSAAEIANNAQTCVGCAINPGTAGAKWTDISLSTSFTGPNFPDPGGTGTPNEAVFQFNFLVLGSDVTAGSNLFLNVVFGDYDVSPANVLVTRANGSTFTIPLTLQGGNQDGLIQAATATLGFFDVFTALGPDWDGMLTVKFVNPNEPYLAFDYAELSLIPLVVVPAPGGLALLAIGLAAFGALRRRNRGV